MSDHERIWLEPRTPNDPSPDERCWCQHDVWDRGDYEGSEPTEYVRADLHHGEIERLRKSHQDLWNRYTQLLDQLGATDA